MKINIVRAFIVSSVTISKMMLLFGREAKIERISIKIGIREGLLLSPFVFREQKGAICGWEQ